MTCNCVHRDIELAEVHEQADMLVEGVTAAMDPALHDDDANLDMLAPSRDPGLSSTAGAPVPEGIIANTVRISCLLYTSPSPRD